MHNPSKLQKIDEGRSLIEQVELQIAVPVRDVERQAEDHFVGGQGQTCLQCSRFS